ncbi:MAG: SGNH/GDSL hydrolase family protein [Lachnospiraceae bacterium]|nr:SGNH/GDSL hydrolase family protein [Lachnospiraceae bacterium]
MKKKGKIAVGLALAATLLLSACASDAQRIDEEVIVRESEPATFTGCVAGCTCSGCICCGTNDMVSVAEPVETTPETETIPEETTTQVQTQPPVNDEPDDDKKVSEFSEGELAARREQQANFAKARDSLYGASDSLDKTEKINQLDRQILANNAYDFSDKTVVFIGDSITEGITSSVDQNGNYISYVTYVNSYLHFGNVLNHGKGGRMFSAYGGEELSLAMNFGNVTNNSADVIVVFAGVNDYLCVAENKRFGSVTDTLTTGNYCGSVRYFMSQLKDYYGDREIFFVTMYDINRTSNSTYVDFDGQPTLGDFMDAEKKLAKEFGFHVIDLYDTGFMDCSSKEASNYFLSDGLHPKDNGSIFLGDHIAAELSLYFGQKEGN